MGWKIIDVIRTLGRPVKGVAASKLPELELGPSSSGQASAANCVEVSVIVLSAHYHIVHILISSPISSLPFTRCVFAVPIDVPLPANIVR